MTRSSSGWVFMTNIFWRFKNMDHQQLSNAISTMFLRCLVMFLHFETYAFPNPQKTPPYVGNPGLNLTSCLIYYILTQQKIWHVVFIFCSWMTNISAPVKLFEVLQTVSCPSNHISSKSQWVTNPWMIWKNFDGDSLSQYWFIEERNLLAFYTGKTYISNYIVFPTVKKGRDFTMKVSH